MNALAEVLIGAAVVCSNIGTYFGAAKKAGQKVEAALVPIAKVSAELIEHIKAKHETKADLTDTKTALQVEITADRDAQFKAAVYSFLKTLNINVHDLNTVLTASLAQYMAEYAPLFKAEVTPDRVAQVLESIEKELEAAKGHPGLQAVQKMMDWMAATGETAAASATASQNAAAPDAVPTGEAMVQTK